MNSVPVFVGLDYHQDSIQLSVVDEAGRELSNRPCSNSWKAVVHRAERYGRVGRAAIESCSGAADLAEELVDRAGWSVELAHPGYVNRMKQNPDKSDYSDAKMLADLTRVGYLPRVWLAPRAIRELRRLVRYRQELVEERRRIKQRVRALLREQRIKNEAGARPWSLRWLVWLETEAKVSEHSRWITSRHLRRIRGCNDEIHDVETHLATITREDPLVKTLRTHPGIGPVTAWMLRAEVGRFDRFRNGKQLSRFCGLSPRNASSGNRQADAGLIRAGNNRLRSILIEAAHRLIHSRSTHLGYPGRRETLG